MEALRYVTDDESTREYFVALEPDLARAATPADGARHGYVRLRDVTVGFEDPTLRALVRDARVVCWDPAAAVGHGVVLALLLNDPDDDDGQALRADVSLAFPREDADALYVPSDCTVRVVLRVWPVDPAVVPAARFASVRVRVLADFVDAEDPVIETAAFPLPTSDEFTRWNPRDGPSGEPMLLFHGMPDALRADFALGMDLADDGDVYEDVVTDAMDDDLPSPCTVEARAALRAATTAPTME